jgi:hypothetical protein
LGIPKIIPDAPLTSHISLGNPMKMSHKDVPDVLGKYLHWPRGYFLYLPQNCHFVPVYNGKSHGRCPRCTGENICISPGNISYICPRIVPLSQYIMGKPSKIIPLRIILV